MAISDPLFTSVAKDNPSNSQTKDLNPGQQTKVSEFLTVQSLTNFAAMTGAITVGWKALKAVSPSSFSTHWTPFVMALIWLAVSVAATATQQEADVKKDFGFWATGIFIGALNSLVLFGAVIGINS
jgi:hypothetical protein